MKRIYLTPFCLFLGILSLGIPHVYSASEDFSEKAISRKYFHVFQTAMQVYRNDNLSAKPYAHNALKELKSYIEISPKAYEGMVLCYLAYNFDKARTNFFLKQLIPIISGFLKKREDENYYQQRRAIMIKWGFENGCYTFCADCLEAEAMYTRLCNIQGMSSGDIVVHKPNYNKTVLEVTNNMYAFYVYRKNFLKNDLLLWLIKDRGWPGPENEKIVAFNNINKRKKLRYIQLLDKGEEQHLKALASIII